MIVLVFIKSVGIRNAYACFVLESRHGKIHIMIEHISTQTVFRKCRYLVVWQFVVYIYIYFFSEMANEINDKIINRYFVLIPMGFSKICALLF